MSSFILNMGSVPDRLAEVAVTGTLISLAISGIVQTRKATFSFGQNFDSGRFLVGFRMIVFGDVKNHSAPSSAGTWAYCLSISKSRTISEKYFCGDLFFRFMSFCNA